MPTKITVRYRSIDGCSMTRTFKTLAGARRFATDYVGEQPDISGFGNYAVSGDGIGKVTVDGCTLHELFGIKRCPALSDDSWDCAEMRSEEGY